MLATALKTLETQPGPIADIIADRVDLAELTEKAVFPRVVNVQVSDIPDGVAHTGEVNVYMTRWQIDSYAQDYDTAERLARALWETLVPLQRYPVADVVITSCRRASQRFFHETAIDKWRFLTEFEFRYSYFNIPGSYRFPDYSPKVLSYSPIVYWPLWEASGSVAVCQVITTQNGTYTGVTLGQEGIRDGRTAPLFDGINDFVDVYSSPFNTAWNQAECTISAWAKVYNNAVWSDGISRNILRFRVDAQNRIHVQRAGGVHNNVSATVEGNNIQLNILSGDVSTLDWLHIAVTVSESADEFKFFVDGVQVGVTINGLGAWSGDLETTATIIGGEDTTPALEWYGWLAHVAAYDRAMTPTEIADLAVV